MAHSIAYMVTYEILSFICVIANIPPLFNPTLRKNAALISFSISVIVWNAIKLINGIIWFDGELIDRAPIWCDVAPRFEFIFAWIVVAANTCIIRHVAKLLAPSQLPEDDSARRLRAIGEYVFIFVPALIVLCFSRYIQASRYTIVPVLGCTFVLKTSWVYVLMRVWLGYLQLGSLCYATLALVRLIRHQRRLRDVLSKSQSPVSMNRFLRLSGLSASYFFVSSPFIGSGIAVLFTHPAWIIQMHDTNKVLLSTSLTTRLVKTEFLTAWTPIFAGLSFIVFFGFAGENSAIYGKLARFLHIDGFVKALRGKLSQGNAPSVVASGPVPKQNGNVGSLAMNAISRSSILVQDVQQLKADEENKTPKFVNEGQLSALEITCERDVNRMD